MLDTDQTVVLFVDLQSRLLSLLPREEAVLEGVSLLAAGCGVLGLPSMWTLQYPEGLGPLHPRMLEAGGEAARDAVAKTSFSVMGDERCAARLESFGRRRVVVCGIETHICIYQTVMDLLAAGYGVTVAYDCVCSRRLEDHEAALAEMRAGGARILPVETILYSMLRDAEAPGFKGILELVKSRARG